MVALEAGLVAVHRAACLRSSRAPCRALRDLSRIVKLSWIDRLLLGAGCLTAAISLAACGSSTTGDSAKKATGSAPAKPATILSEPVEPTTFAQARAAMVAVYRSHPTIRKFTVRDVEYTSATRDKVLGVCHKGGAEKSASSLESARVLACAPLIYYLYEYGRSARAPDAVDAARKLYWYAVVLQPQAVPGWSGPVAAAGQLGGRMRLVRRSERHLAFSKYHANVLALADGLSAEFVGTEAPQLSRRGSINAKFL